MADTTPRRSRAALGASWPTVGRALATGAATEALTDERGHGVLVLGAGGLGKTHLARRVAEAHAAATGALVVPLHAAAGRSTVPLDALEPLLGGIDAGRSWTRSGLAERLAEILAERGAGRPVVLLVDDAQHLDESSAACLAAVARAGFATLLATARTTVDLDPTWSALWKEGVVERVDLTPLTADDVRDLLVQVLGGDVRRDVVHGLWTQTGGNPFHLREALFDALDSGWLQVRGGVWSPVGSPRAGRRLVDLVGAELAGLDDAERTVVETVALTEPIPTRRLAAAVDGGALDRLVERGLVVLDRGFRDRNGFGQVARLVHPLYADAVLEAVPPGRRRHLFESMAADDWGHGVPQPLPGLLRSVLLALDVGLAPPVPALLDAASAAGMLEDDLLPIQAATAALAQLGPDALERVDALVLRADAQRARLEIVLAAQDLDEALGLLDRLDPHQVGYVDRYRAALTARATLRFHNEADLVGAMALFDEGIERFEQLADAGVVVDRPDWFRDQRLNQLGFAGFFPEHAAEFVARQADPALDPRNRIVITMVTCFGLAQQGHLEEASARVLAALDLAAAHVDQLPWAPSELRATWFCLCWWAGDLDGVDTILGLDPDAAPRPRIDQAIDQVGEGIVAGLHGRWRDALAHCRAATARFEERDQTGYLPFVLAQHAKAAVAAGESAEARTIRARLASAAAGATGMFEGRVRLDHLAGSVGLGEPTAVAEATALAGWARERDYALVELEALHLLVVADPAAPDRESHADRITELRARVDGVVARRLADHALALLDGDAALAAGHLADLVGHGVWVPLVVRRDDLSRREREIAELAATGMRSREIAERLYLSPRTVDTHLARVFRKLGINRRSDLAGALAAG